MKTKLIEYYNSAKQKSVYYNCAILDPRVSLDFLSKNSKQKNVPKKRFLEDLNQYEQTTGASASQLPNSNEVDDEIKLNCAIAQLKLKNISPMLVKSTTP